MLENGTFGPGPYGGGANLPLTACLRAFRLHWAFRLQPISRLFGSPVPNAMFGLPNVDS